MNPTTQLSPEITQALDRVAKELGPGGEIVIGAAEATIMFVQLMRRSAEARPDGAH